MRCSESKSTDPFKQIEDKILNAYRLGLSAFSDIKRHSILSNSSTETSQLPPNYDSIASTKLNQANDNNNVFFISDNESFKDFSISSISKHNQKQTQSLINYLIDDLELTNDRPSHKNSSLSHQDYDYDNLSI